MKHLARGAFLFAAVVLTLGGYRDALASSCKPDGGTCRTNQSCCSRLCAKAPPAKFGVCCTPGECPCSGAGDCPIGMAATRRRASARARAATRTIPSATVAAAAKAPASPATWRAPAGAVTIARSAMRRTSPGQSACPVVPGPGTIAGAPRRETVRRAVPACSPASPSAPRRATSRTKPRATAAAARGTRSAGGGLASPAPRTRRAGTRGRRAWTARAPAPRA